MKNTYKCDVCGKFTHPSIKGTSQYFVPDSEFTYEDVGIRCEKCTDKYGVIDASQGCNTKYCSWINT